MKSLLLFTFFLSVYIQIIFCQTTVTNSQKISDIAGSFTGSLSNNDQFGQRLDGIGDLNNDGIEDIAVGAPNDDDGGGNRGAVWILFLDTNGTVKSHQKISSTQGNFSGILTNGSLFGSSIRSIDDFDNDGVTDIAVGAMDYGTYGSVWILCLNANGTVKTHSLICAGSTGFNPTVNGNRFGLSIANIGDLNSDGVTDIAVGSREHDGGYRSGAFWVLFLNSNGTVKNYQKVSDTCGNFTGILNTEDYFGICLEKLGDLNGDSILDIAVGARCDDDGGTNKGAVYILFLDTNGTVKYHTKINDTTLGFNLNNNDWFGASIANLGDIDGDSVVDIAVGAAGYPSSSSTPGNIWILSLYQTGDVKSYNKIGTSFGGFTGTLSADDQFGYGVANIGDVNDDCIVDVLVGARNDDDGGVDRGAVWVLFLNNPTAPMLSCTVSTPANMVCYGDTVILTANYNVTSSQISGFQWYKDSTIVAGATNQIYQATVTGNYWVKVTGLCAVNSDTISVFISPAINPNLGNDTSICQGNNVMFTATSGYTSYLWQDSTNNQYIIADSTGVYWVEVVDNNGCTGRDSVVLTVSPPVVINLGNDTTICQGSTVMFDPGGGYSTYYWQNGSGNQFYFAGTAGTYWVEVTNSIGCAGRDSVELFVLPAPYINLGPDTTILIIDTITINAGPGYSSYSWSTGDTIQSVFIDAQILGFGVFTYILTVSDSNGCTNSDTIKVFVDDFTNIGRTVKNNLFTVYPNPSNDFINIEFSNYSFGKGKLELYNIVGTVVYTKDVNLQKSNLTKIDISDFTKGVYLIIYQDKHSIQTCRVVIQ